MRSALPRTLTVLFAVLLLVLAAAGAWAAHRGQEEAPGAAAEARTAGWLEDLRTGSAAVDAARRTALVEDLDAQEQTLAEDARTSPQRPDGRQAPHDAAGLAAEYRAAGTAVLHEARTADDADRAARLASIGASLWVSGLRLDGTSADLADASSAVSRDLADATGTAPSSDLSSGSCPAGSVDDAARSLYRAQWAGSFLAARTDTDGLDQAGRTRLARATALFGDQLRQLREAHGADCGKLPAQQVGYRLADGQAGTLVADESTALAGQSLTLWRAQAQAGQADGAWASWSLSWLVADTALQAEATGDVPALAGA